MRHVGMVLGLLMGGALLLNYALVEGSQEVLGPAVDEAVANAEAFSAMKGGSGDPEAIAAIERMGDDPSRLDAWYDKAGDAATDSPSSDPELPPPVE